MTGGRFWTGNSRKLAILLLAVTLPPAATLVWLGWQLLMQDRSLLAQRDFERRRAATDAAVHSLQLAIADAERHLVDDPVPAGMVRFHVSPAGIRAEPPDRVAWLPARAAVAVENSRFAAAEMLEFGNDANRALNAYVDIVRSTDPSVRAGALLRIARIRRRQAQWDAALQAYRDLARLDTVIIEGTSASLQARRAICDVLAETGRTPELRNQAAALAGDLLGGGWAVDRPAWELTLADLERWTGHKPIVSAEREAFSGVADAIWLERPADIAHLIPSATGPITLLARDYEKTGVVLAIAPSVIRKWADRAAASTPSGRVSIVGPSGEIVIGNEAAEAAAIVRVAASDSGLPWTIAVQSAGLSSAAAELANRRRLLSAGLAAILVLLGGGSYFLWRVVQRELAVARLQAEFVSAVSHEFRTPLTSLRHMTELLQERDDLPDDRRSAFYEALGRNTERLHRLVESLLDFGRMESGRRLYDLRLVDAATLVAQIVTDFRQEVSPRGIAVDLDVRVPPDTHVNADASAFSNALLNLLDNAVKYSPDCPVVHVSVDLHPGGIAIAVRDEGLGIPAHEQKEIFGRFVRGSRAAKLGIKGTGLGLAMVSHIVRAHGGVIELTSEEHAGSTFTIVIPCPAS